MTPLPEPCFQVAGAINTAVSGDKLTKRVPERISSCWRDVSCLSLAQSRSFQISLPSAPRFEEIIQPRQNNHIYLAPTSVLKIVFKSINIWHQYNLFVGSPTTRWLPRHLVVACALPRSIHSRASCERFFAPEHACVGSSLSELDLR